MGEPEAERLGRIRSEHKACLQCAEKFTRASPYAGEPMVVEMVRGARPVSQNFGEFSENTGKVQPHTCGVHARACDRVFDANACTPRLQPRNRSPNIHRAAVGGRIWSGAEKLFRFHEV